MFFFYFNLNETDETKTIEEINQLLAVLEKELKQIPLVDAYSSIMISGRIICESMTKLLLEKDGHYYNEKNSFYENIETLHGFDLIPKEPYDFLNLIRTYANKAAHGIDPPSKLIYSFLKALQYFIQWFNNNYFQKYQKTFQIEKCCEIIDLFIYDEKNDSILIDSKNDDISSIKENEIIISQIKEIENEKRVLEEEKRVLEEEKRSIGHLKTELENNQTKKNELKEEIKRLNEKWELKEQNYQKQIDNLNKKNDEFLEKLDGSRKILEKCMEIIVESNERGKRMESKIDDLHSKIDFISNQIKTMQSLTERQINNAQTAEEFERIMKAYMDECIENIMQYSINFTENQNFQIEKKKLIYSIGEEGWNKLCEKSKTFLITSKVMYNYLVTMDDIIDYSGICVLVTKSLEVELHKRFFTEFLDYLNEKYEYDYKKYHTALLYKKNKPLFSETFTLGNIAYVLCYKESKWDNDTQKDNNKLKLMEYCRNCLFSRYNDDEIEELLTRFASAIEEIKDKYRNPSAHTNEIRRIDAEECFNLVLDIEKLLKKMLDSFDK